MVFYQLADRLWLEALRYPQVRSTIEQAVCLTPSKREMSLTVCLATCHMSLWYQSDETEVDSTKNFYCTRVLPSLIDCLRQHTAQTVSIHPISSF